MPLKGKLQFGVIALPCRPEMNDASNPCMSCLNSWARESSVAEGRQGQSSPGGGPALCWEVKAVHDIQAMGL